MSDLVCPPGGDVPAPPPEESSWFSSTCTASLVDIVLVDFGNTGVDLGRLPAIAAAIQVQTQRDLALPPPFGYGLAANVRVAGACEDVRPHEWVVGLFATPDQPGAYGYHQSTPTGRPYGKVFPRLMPAADLATTVSHEVVEMLCDPFGNVSMQGPDGRMWALECADAVEADRGYLIDGIEVSNWCTPAWYGGVRGAKFDFLGTCKQPFEVRPGGYAQHWIDTKGWVQVYHSHRAPSEYRKALRLLRAGRGVGREALVVERPSLLEEAQRLSRRLAEIHDLLQDEQGAARAAQ